ncbi:MAG: hypothetical protein KGI38_10915 [Thaumarchaeota archaeon]|nr:hypothetical protein [Nitrososphaerota archaeon]
MGRRDKRSWVIGISAIGIVILMLTGGLPQRATGQAAGMGSQNSGLEFAPGPDSSVVCNVFPCASVMISGNGRAGIALSLGEESVESPQPATYYTDLLRLTNPTSSAVSVTAVLLTGLTEARPGDIGRISVFYCLNQTDAPSGSCLGSYSTDSQGGGTIFSGADSIPPGATRYIELVGFAGPNAQPGDSISFALQVVSAGQ